MHAWLTTTDALDALVAPDRRLLDTASLASQAARPGLHDVSLQRSSDSLPFERS